MENSVFRRILDSETFNDRIIVTVLLGNGFDLSCGLKTRYTNIYDEYINTPSASENIKQFKLSLSNYDTWADFEWAMRDHMAEFKSGEDFLECLRDFRDFMTEYLKKQEAAFNKMLDNKAACRKAETEIHDSLKRICNELGIGFIQDCEWRFITFNYTNTADRLLGGYGRVVHVHGILADSPVLGINDEKQFESGLAYPITEEIKTSFVKPIFNDDYKPGFNSEVESIIASSNHIVSYGLSFGETDKKWLGAVLNRLAELSSAELHVFDYKCMKSYAKHGDTKISAQREAKKQLKEKTLIPNAPEWARVSFPCVKPLFDIGPIFADFAVSNKNAVRSILKGTGVFWGICVAVLGIALAVDYFSQNKSSRDYFELITSIAVLIISFLAISISLLRNETLIRIICTVSGTILLVFSILMFVYSVVKDIRFFMIFAVIVFVASVLSFLYPLLKKLKKAS